MSTRFPFRAEPQWPSASGPRLFGVVQWAEGAQRAGAFLLRIEDIDTMRCTPALAEQCLQDLAWLGLKWEEPVLPRANTWRITAPQ